MIGGVPAERSPDLLDPVCAFNQVLAGRCDGPFSPTLDIAAFRPSLTATGSSGAPFQRWQVPESEEIVTILGPHVIVRLQATAEFLYPCPHVSRLQATAEFLYLFFVAHDTNQRERQYAYPTAPTRPPSRQRSLNDYKSQQRRPCGRFDG